MVLDILKQNTEFKLVKGKRCIVLAPSGYLKGRGKESRELMNSFDYVVKTTYMCEIDDPDLDLGERCDIWYGLPQNKGGWQVSADALRRQNVKELRLQPCIAQYENTWYDYVSAFIKRNEKERLNYSIAQTKVYQKLVDEMECIPFSGVFAIADLLANGAEFVFAYGYDFYRSGYFNGATTINAANEAWHKFEPQMHYFWKLLKDEPRFDCDSNLKSILIEKFGTADEKTSFSQSFLSEQLQKLSFVDNNIIFRSCNIDDFTPLLETLLRYSEKRNIDVVCQPEVVSIIKQFGIEPYIYDGQSKFTCEALVQMQSIKSKKYRQCILPYNGRPLLEYYELLKFVDFLAIEKAIFISKRGLVKQIENVRGLLERIEWYINQRENFFSIMTEVDRKECF